MSFIFFTKEFRALGFFALIFGLIFLFFYPPFYVSIDEHQYVKNSYLLLTGSIRTSEPELFCGGHPISDTEWVSSQSIGKSVLLTPFMFLPFDFLFLFGLLTHLVNFILIIFILRQQKINVYGSLLYLFFPAFQWSARTLFPELNVLTFFLIAYYFWNDSKERAWVSGLFLGAALAIRYDAALGLFAFGLQALVFERKKLIPLVAGAALPIFLLLAFNHVTYGDFFTTGYGSVGEQTSFSIPGDFLVSAGTYAALLFLALPFSLWALAKHPHKLLFGALVGASIFAYSYYSPFWHFDFSLPLTFTARLRYFIPVLGLLLIPCLAWYAQWGKKHAHKFESVNPHAKTGVALILIAVLLFSVLLHAQHAQLGQSRKDVSDTLHSLIPIGSTVIGSADDCIYFLPSYFGSYYYQKATADMNLPTRKEVFLIDISYSTQQDKNGIRQETVEAERAVIKKVIAGHMDQLSLVYTSQAPRHITIWQVKE